MKILLIFLILFFSLFLEAGFVALPFVLVSLLLFAIIFQENWIFPVAFGIGILLDMLTFRTIGTTSLFFSFMLGGIFLYKRKFEIQSVQFVLVSTFIAAVLYSLILSKGNFFLETIFSAILSGVIFFLLTKYILGAHYSR